jgi:hypothetical protein
VATSWHSYPQIFNMGHRYVKDLLTSRVLVEEKVDGSQFSFGVFKEELDGGSLYRLRVRSKGAEMVPEAPEKMFASGVAWVRENEHRLTPGWTYRGEFLAKPKHNVLAYDRVPHNHIILFDINPSEEDYLSWEFVCREAERLGLEVVPRLFDGRVESLEQFREYLSRESVLGGQKIEGVVCKNYALFGQDKKVLMGKFVSEAYKEVHAGEWKTGKAEKADVLQQIIERYKTPARWQKALIHLRERGLIDGSPKDIGALMREVWPDVVKEEEGAIKDALFAWAEDKIRRGVTSGLPEWYKGELLKAQFENES